MDRKIFCTVVFGLLFLSVVNAEVNWPCFRGTSCGIAEDKVLPISWSVSENVIWKTDIAGRAWSCPIVWSNKVFLTTVASEGQVEDARKGLYLGGDRNKPSSAVHHWIVYCYDWDTGTRLWEKTVHTGRPPEPVHIKNTYASETPVTDGKRVYFYFGNLGVYCFSIDGIQLWHKKIKPVKMRYNWGTAASPLVHDDRLFIVNDNEQGSYLLALDTKTGDEIFRIKREEKSNWATPYIWQNSLRTELVTCGTGKNISYDMNGKVLWELGKMSSITIPVPVEMDGMIYISSGFVGDRKNRPIFAVRPGGEGDITPASEMDTGKFIAWYRQFAGPYNPSPIAYRGRLYVLYDRGYVSCYNGKTGEIIYERQQLAEDARAFTASPWANDGKLFFLSEDGDTFIIQAGSYFKVLRRNSLGEMCMTTPAALRGSIIIRTLNALYRIGDR